MAPIKSSLSRSVSKLLGVFKDTDLSLRGDVQSSRIFTEIPFSATGGTKITSGSDIYHVFLYTGSPQTFSVEGSPGSLTAKVLVVGGGGSGGYTSDGVSGGGGAGGIQYYTSYPITDGDTTVVVGNRGANPGTNSDYTADPSINDGEDTTFGNAVGYGGGGGAHQAPGVRNEAGHNGGSGGGGSSYPYPGEPGGTATQPGAPLVSGAGGTNYGKGGGSGMGGNPGVGGGGGGSNSGPPGTGKDGDPGDGAGGDGQAFPEFPAPVFSPVIPSGNRSTIGPTGLFAGGGAGGPGAPGTRTGGAGGGGDSGPGTSASDGTNATGYGSGGSGTQFGSSNTNGSPAGSPGIVIVKYTTS